MAKEDQILLHVDRLHLAVEQQAIVSGLSLKLVPGKVLGMVGASGSGKTQTGRAIMGLIEAPIQHKGGHVWYQHPERGRIDLLAEPPRSLRRIRGQQLGMVFQEPGSALNPVFRCGTQLVEALKLHESLSTAAASKRARTLLQSVGMADIDRAFWAYPHQLSGGEQQRVMIALAIACNPRILIADEPSASLDAHLARQLVDLLRRLTQQAKMALLLITHDLSLVASVADELLIVENGVVREKGGTKSVLAMPAHPYTRQLLHAGSSQPLRAEGGPKPDRTPSEGTKLTKLWEVSKLCVTYRQRSAPWRLRAKTFQAVEDVSFAINRGECLGLVGPSGCGKSSLARAMLRLEPSTAERLLFDGHNLATLPAPALRRLRPEMQMIFQRPLLSLNPRQTVGQALEEPLRVHGLEAGSLRRKQRAMELLQEVGLAETHYHRYPHALSGGERQRLCLARCLSLRPAFLVCDECVSSLDVVMQHQILELLVRLQASHGLTYLFISHDLRVVRQICQRVMVMHQGKLVEIRETEALMTQPEHAITKKMLQSIQIL